MAILWEKIHGGKRYQVRSAGRSRRLYTDGVFHSQFNPARPVTGSVWDLLLLPAFFHGPESVRRVLLLGVGGGAVIRQLQHFLRPDCIHGVELNAIHLQVARRFFGVSGPGLRLIRADAQLWLERYQGPAFDLIIDDLFGEEAGEPVRPVAADPRWAELLLRHLTPQGTLVTNFGSTAELRASAYWTSDRIRNRFRSRYRLTTPLYGNVVAALLRRRGTPSQLRAHLRAIPGLNPEVKRTGLRFQVRRL